jgi:hypothetical protein
LLRRCQAQVLLQHNGSSDGNPAGVTPRVFLSYSRDSGAHRAWVRLLAGPAELVNFDANHTYGDGPKGEY